LIAHLQDDHARIVDEEFLNGMLPVLLHRLDNELYVVASVFPDADALPEGTRVTAIDGSPVPDALRTAESTVSAATSGWRMYESAAAIGYGFRGQMVAIDAVQPNGKSVRTAVPRVDFDTYADTLREQHPPSGTEVAPGVFYVDLDKLEITDWDALLPKLSHARAIIFELRGYMNAAFSILGHFTDRVMLGPVADIPIVTARGPSGSEQSQPSIAPRLPRLSAKLIFLVDGRTASAPETLLEYVTHYKLGRVVGEPTGGTNGNPTSFETLGGLRVRFTGMRILGQDGRLLHGHGFQPDVLVQPTASALSKGRDEILEKAIAVAGE
jgi:hypothetical protein